MKHSLLLGIVMFTIALTQNVYSDQVASVESDMDHDGVPDIVDKCPNTSPVYKVDPDSRIAPLFEPEHLQQTYIAVSVDGDGCARDTDKDGIPDHRDYCPEDTSAAISAGVTGFGCPSHSDFDGTPDYRDKCPGTLRGIPADRFGCPKIVGDSFSGVRH